ncbi:hypothetical protein GURKE_03080 [Brevundimonas phage vB_BpoS-Gurke]|uniref:Uncharacterized protein n=1 Tax=Brevundimonas phage vB_BpoS-Gurke TaxID=2948599 RepID=A0A9E7N531_9CAUD|nr:hypothetical protein GURKE_03080 [Brevundimonas phage vB_BpoS-Gurke]
MLQPVHGYIPDRTRWCGPTALAAITGLPYADCLERFRQLRRNRGRRAVVKGVAQKDMRAVLIGLGYRIQDVTPAAGPSLARWLDNRAGADALSTFLIVAGNHYITVRGDEGLCSLTHGKPVPLAQLKKRRAAVTDAWRIVKPAQLTLTPLPKPKPCPIKRMDQQHYQAFRAFARAQGFTYRRYDEAGLPYVQTSPFGPFPKGIDTMHHGWDETLERLRTCVAHPDEVHNGYYSE